MISERPEATRDNCKGQVDGFPANLVAAAIRHGPYKNSANAIAEIVDNSYDAHATEIHVAIICGADGDQPHTMAVLDNGVGMDKDALRHCIQYGTHQPRKTSRDRLGKFGVGLLSASFNQCQELAVCSWTDGLRQQVDSTMVTVDNCILLPPVESRPLPDFFDAAFSSFDRNATNLDTHGTLVVWRQLDRMTWKRADKIMAHLQRELGRIYRNFLAAGTLKIAINIVKQSGNGFIGIRKEFVEPVDPLFLSHWRCDELNQYVEDLQAVARNPGKYGVEAERVKLALEQKSLFIPFDFENETDNTIGENGIVKQAEYSVMEDGKVLGKYRITASFRRPQIVRAAAHAGLGSPRNTGDTKYGRLAQRLRGVSIMRGGRELTLDANWLRADTTIDRWIALSLDFDPSLDALFGVSYDKQMAKSLAELAQVKIDDDAKEEYNLAVLEAAERVQRIMSRTRRLVHSMDSPGQMGAPDSKRPAGPAHEDIQAVRDTSGRLQKRSERDPSITVEGIDDTPLDVDRFSDGLKGAVFENEQASAVRPRVVDINNLKYDIVADPSLGRSDMFVPINNASGAMIIRLNTEHPLYQTLQHISGGYEDREGELDVQQLNARLTKAMTTIRKMIIAFSRAELEAARSPAEKELLEGVRREWSNITRDLIDEEE